ncbi:hypothetical protein BofuT4_uP146390.1 [Botrytis cinerea T4]|uniref:Uncharacterized protein n=1 Tax=Botryotinia fuckeliana (strain T4) TaxID=999810 RepID=G2YXX2_BOTF4|nr:hypothetical protein BofuT4_uP146390.1 [Botrytis cinerea T4]
MKCLLPVAATLQWVAYVQAKAAFAHFMVTNSQNYTAADWSDDISLAQAAHIDAFALNMAYDDPDSISSSHLTMPATVPGPWIR